MKHKLLELGAQMKEEESITMSSSTVQLGEVTKKNQTDVQSQRANNLVLIEKFCRERDQLELQLNELRKKCEQEKIQRIM